MTLRNPPTFLQAGQHPAENTRLALSGLLGSPQGVFAGGVISDSVADGDPGHGRVHPDDFRVSQNGTPNMSVNVAAGAAWIRGTESATQGSYHAVSDDTVNLTIGTADATNTRLDLVVLRVKDADYSGSDNEVVLDVVAGTAAGSPVDPSVPDNCLVLARVTVAASASSIVDADIENFSITPVGFRFAGRIVFTAGGTFSKGDYPWLRAVNVRVQGGGGGGGGAAATGSGEASFGSGGGGGGYAESFITDLATISDQITVTVGGGGTASTGNGGSGSASSFGSLVTGNGGAGGGARAASTTFFTVAAGAGGGGTGQIVVDGSTGHQGYASGQLGGSGAGGDSHLGAGGRAATPTTSSGQKRTGNAGNNFGGGGSGALNAASATATAAGAGAAGIVIVDLYA